MSARPSVAWVWVVGWVAVIFLAIPMARTLTGTWTGWFGRGSLGLVVIVLAALGALGAIRGLRRAGQLRLRQVLVLGLVAAAFIQQTVARMRANLPEEALHFVEYGVLTVLVFQALGRQVTGQPLSNRLAVPATLLLVAIVGTVDEIVQWLTPGRYFDFRDIGLNVGAGLLMLVALTVGLSPAWLRVPGDGRSRQLVRRLAAPWLVLLTGCCLSTPRRVEWIAQRVPGLGFLAGNPSVMLEYGYRHGAPHTGTFTSRLDLGELLTQDLLRADEAAQLLDPSAPPQCYGEFLERWPGALDPFLHEARVHLFRRDNYLNVGRARLARLAAEGREPDVHERADIRSHMTVAWFENQILENFFGATLGRTSFAYPDEFLALLLEHADLQAAYTSAVSSHLIHRVDERLALALEIAALVLAALLWCRPRPTGEPAR